MKKRIVKILSMVLLCAALIIPFGLTSLAASNWNITVDGVVYKIIMATKYTDTEILVSAAAYVNGYDKETVPENVVILPEVQSDSVYGMLDCPVVGINRLAFNECDKVKTLTIEDNPKLESCGDFAFSNCQNLTSVTLPDNFKEIYLGMFSGCTSLNSINFPKSLEKISAEGLKNCGFESLTVPATVKVLGFKALSNNTKLREISFEKLPETVGESVLAGCTVLEKVNFPVGIKEIYNRMFSDCTGLKSIEIPNTVETIGKNAFKGCTSLEFVNIPSSVKTMGDGVFMNCTSLTTFEIPDTVTKLGHSMFSGCTYLESVKLPDAASSYYAMFFNCKKLKKVDIGAGVEDITMAFSGCTSLSELYLPAAVKNIGNDFIADCPKLSRITVDEKNPYYSSDDNGILYNKNKTKLIKSPQGMGYSVSIPRTVTEIGEKAFEGCKDMKMVRISKNVTKIYYNAFYTVTRPYQTMEGITFICREGSAAYEFAQDNSIATITECDHYEIEHIYFAPTCTKKGYRCDICKECRERFTESEYLPATGHTAGEWELSEDGKEIRKCKDCGEILETREAQPLDTNGSNQVIGEDNVGKAPTQPTSFMARLTSFFARIFGILFRK